MKLVFKEQKNEHKTRGGVKMPSEKEKLEIKQAVGAHSVYLAAKHDENLVGRFTHTDGKSLVDDNIKATKRSIANVMVYMAGQYGQQLTSEEVEMGLLAAAPVAKSTGPRQKTGPNFDDIGKVYADKLADVLTANEIGVEIKTIIDRFELYDPTSGSYRTLEQALGVAMRMLEWTRRRQMTDGTRAYRWYPPVGFFDRAETVDVEPTVQEVVESNGIDEVFDDDWSDEIVDEVDDVFEVEAETTVEDKPKPKQTGKGVKPDTDLLARIQTMNLYPGISSYEVALSSYDFIGNGIDVPKAQEDMPHKAKLSVGATMKSMSWTKRTRRIEGIPHVGWHPPKDWEPPVAAEGVIRRKPEPLVEAAPVEKLSLQDSLPRLSEQADDDLPWPDQSEFVGDPGEEGEHSNNEEIHEMYIKLVNPNDGSEDIVLRTIAMKNTGMYLMGTKTDPMERMLEWDAEEEIWICTMGSAEE